MFIAGHDEGFRDLFSERLLAMLSSGSAGAFILVLANSLQDRALQSSLQPRLDQAFTDLSRLDDGGDLDATADDLAVFRALRNTGIGALDVWTTRVVGGWELNFNPLRALRPARASGECVTSIHREFDARGFNFNRPFLQPEILWEGVWQHVPLRVLYNKFPFAPWHLIVVPDAEAQLPQYLDEARHALMWELVALVQQVLPGFAAGYNSIGACASVNQLHFQGFIRGDVLPLEQPHWCHNGGDTAYPMACTRSDSLDASWSLIHRLHAANRPYNLLYRPGCCYVLERRMQGSEGIEPLVRGAGWIEECGVFNIAEQARFESIRADELVRSIESLSV